MKLTTYLIACKTKSTKMDPASTEKKTAGNAYLGFRLRDKHRDIKVRTDIRVVGAYWDNAKPGYRRTRMVPKAERMRVETLVQGIILQLEKEYRSEKADAAWMRDVIDHYRCSATTLRPSPPTFVERYEQYLREHAMAPNSHRIYTSTLTRTNLHPGQILLAGQSHPAQVQCDGL